MGILTLLNLHRGEVHPLCCGLVSEPASMELLTRAGGIHTSDGENLVECRVITVLLSIDEEAYPLVGDTKEAPGLLRTTSLLA